MWKNYIEEHINDGDGDKWERAQLIYNLCSKEFWGCPYNIIMALQYNEGSVLSTCNFCNTTGMYLHHPPHQVV